MFWGHAPNHVADTFRFLNLQTMKVVVSIDVVWLNQCYGDWKGNFKNNYTYVEEFTDDSDTKVEFVDSVAPNPGRILEVDEWNDSIDSDGLLNPDLAPREEDIEEAVVEEQ
jgi:hypothetical protein